MELNLYRKYFFFKKLDLSIAYWVLSGAVKSGRITFVFFLSLL